MLDKIIIKIKNKSWKSFVTSLDIRYGLGALERNLASNWFNPFLTIWLNFRSFPMSVAIFFPVFVYGRPRIYGLSGNMEVKGKVVPGMIKFNQTRNGSPSNMDVHSEICNNGLIIFRGRGIIGTGCRIFVAQGKVLDFGANFKITDMCNIGCFSGIIIGEQSRITHRCQILDANYHYVANFNKKLVPYWTKPIKIGKGCWICNSVTISSGAILPDFTIVASNSLVSKDFSDIPESSMIGGIPAKYLASGLRRIENVDIERKIGNFYKQNPKGIFEIPSEDTPEIYSKILRFK